MNGNVRRVEIWLLQYFGETQVDLVTENRLGDYAEWRQSQLNKPAVHTLKNERTTLNQMLNFAKRKGYIREIPKFRIKSVKANARSDLPGAEWLKLTQALNDYVSRAQDGRRRRERFYLRQYIQLAANMGTSVEMIDNFYGKKRMRDPKMASEITKQS